MYNGWTPSVDRKTQIANHFASVRQLIKDNPTSQYWRDELERIKTEYEQHPVDFTQAVERALAADENADAENAEIAEWLGDTKRMVVSATPTKVTVSRSWAERHLNTDEGFTAALDKAFGAGNWTVGGEA